MSDLEGLPATVRHELHDKKPTTMKRCGVRVQAKGTASAKMLAPGTSETFREAAVAVKW